MPQQAESRGGWARRRGYAVLRATGLSGLLALAAWTPAAGQEGAEARVTADRLNFREECGVSSPVLGVLTRDETVTVLGSELGTWVRVRNADGDEGCVSAQYLEIDSTPSEAESKTMPSEDPSPYAWADMTDPDSAEIVSEIEELEDEFATTSDPDEQEELRQEIAELEDDLRARQQELAEERAEADREAREAELVKRQEASDRHASDARRSAYRVHTNQDWTGFYIGASLGYGFGSEVSATNNLGTSPEGDVDGVDGGIQIGWNHQFSRFVLGIEGDYLLSGQSGSSELGTIGFPGSSVEIVYDSFGTVRIRSGFTAGQVLVYATGGYAFAEGEGRVSGPLGDTVSPRSFSVDGWAAGAGALTALTNHVSLKAEIVYHEFDDEPEVEDAEFFSARVGVNWHF